MTAGDMMAEIYASLATAQEVNITEVNGVAVTSVDDFKGLTQEEHDKLLATATKSDVFNAAML